MGGDSAESGFGSQSKCKGQRFLAFVEGEKFLCVEFLSQSDVQHIEAAAADPGTVERGPFCCGAKDRNPIHGLGNQSAASQIAVHVGPCRANLRGGKDATKHPESEGVSHLQAM